MKKKLEQRISLKQNENKTALSEGRQKKLKTVYHQLFFEHLNKKDVFLYPDQLVKLELELELVFTGKDLENINTYIHLMISDFLDSRKWAWRELSDVRFQQICCYYKPKKFEITKFLIRSYSDLEFPFSFWK